ISLESILQKQPRAAPRAGRVRCSGPHTEQRRAMLTVSVQEYDIADVRGRVERRQTQRGGTATMKLTTVTHVSVDGVMQGLGGADEDRRGGFERGGWAPPLFVDDAYTFLNQVYQRADAFLFGRRTYEIFAGSWGAWPDPGDRPIWP